MKKLLSSLILSAALLAPLAAEERKDIPTDLTWDLTQVYPNLQAWSADKEKLKGRIGELARFRGHLGDSPQTLAKLMATWLELRKSLDRLASYTMFLYDQDTRESRHLELNQQSQALSVQFEEAASFIRPELLALGKPKVDAMIAHEPQLQKLRPILDDILRFGAHTQGDREEKIIAQAGDLKSAGENIRGIFSEADLPYPEVTLSDGTRVRLDAAAYTKYRASAQRDDRLRVFQAFWGRYNDFRRTLAATLYAQVKAHMFEKSVHNYSSCLEAALFPENIPPSVYSQLLKDVHANLPTLHRYLKLRQSLMGVDKLGYEDLYAPIIAGTDLKFTPQEAMQLTLESAAPLGADYTRVLAQAYKDRWVDFLPSTGKRSGAYSAGSVYDVHPFQLLNFTGRYDDVSTLAHESGHSMHSYLSNQNQPFGLHNYSIFVAEVASTLNENLLFHFMLERENSREVKLFLLGSYLENLRATLFRQTLLAEFELKIHEMAESGQPLTGDNLNKLYLQLLRQYYGHEQGICQIDQLYGVEWAYIPHFYYNFYVYQYATSMLASSSIAERIRTHQPGAREAYLKMLSSGSSRYPIELLKGAGVDMTTSQPFEAAMKEMNRVMDEIEKLR